MNQREIITYDKEFKLYACCVCVLLSLIVIVSWLFAVQPAVAGYATGQTQVCFMPGGDCQAMIVDKINKTQRTIHVQAYHLTNPEIIDALLKAARRGVKVSVIVDKAAVKEAAALQALIPIYVDYRPAIAHNKVMIFDDTSFVTGSYNFTVSAQKRNAENALWEYDESNAGKYEENFEKRLALSVTLSEYGVNWEKRRVTPSSKVKQ